jgi:diaminohydroxyphosphoribosylaminopyrimidine deaminase/5-amino-6-(5-phosphoribosylamino)uracil reductase
MNSEILLGRALPELQRGQKLSDSQAMEYAIQEGFKGSGWVSPNPMVGCVVLDSDNNFLSSGYHKKFGGPHAEVEAFSILSDEQAKDAKVFVTLEPCSHFGKTPPCVDLLIRKKVRQVTYGLQDPNPQVRGQGLAKLHSAGISVKESLVFKNELRQVCEHFLINQNSHRAFVSVKIAASLDGMSGLKSGESKWITNEYSRNCSHQFRASHDAIAVGVETIKKDNPNLNVRGFQHRAKRLVVFDNNFWVAQNFSNLNISKHFSLQDLVTVSRDPKSNPFKDLKVLDGSVDWRIELYKLGINSVFIEGGPKLISYCLNTKIADRLYIFQAPVLIGSIRGRHWTEELDIGNLNNKLTLDHVKIQPMEGDFLITAKLNEQR